MRSLKRLRSRRAGLTLVELIVAFSILLILSTMALPLTQIKVQREKERRLRDALEEMRTAIDRYKDAADAGLLGEIDPENHGYPESLDILVEGVEVQAGAGGGLGGPSLGAGQSSGIGGPGGIGGRDGVGGTGAFSNSRRQGATSGLAGSRSGGLGGASNRSRSNSGGQRGPGASSGSDDEEQKMRFLRRIPVDPMTGRAEWGMRSVSDSPDAMSWGGRNVFDVYSLSAETGLDGTPYNQW